MNLKTFIDHAKLDFSNLYFSASDGTGYFHPYTIRPNDFITFAKADFYTPDTRGLVNALSNAKRAIDCQADAFLKSVGLDPDRLDKQLGKDGLVSIAYGKTSKEGPLKFRLLEALGVATPSIVGRMRQLRNLLEHEYKKPSRRSVNDSIGIGELFVQACGGKMKSMFDGIGLGSGISTLRGENEIARELYIRFHNRPEAHFEVFFWNREALKSVPPPRIKVRIGDNYFVPLLKLNCQTEWDKDMTDPVKSFLAELGFRVPKKFRVRDGDNL